MIVKTGYEQGDGDLRVKYKISTLSGDIEKTEKSHLCTR
jgi:hypothetical protein